MLVLLGWTTFFLDPHNIDTRLSIALTLVLAINVVQVVLVENTPETAYLSSLALFTVLSKHTPTHTPFVQPPPPSYTHPTHTLHTPCTHPTRTRTPPLTPPQHPPYTTPTPPSQPLLHTPLHP